VQTGLTLLSLLLFVLIYLALVAGSAWLVYLAVIFPVPVNKLGVLVKLGAIGGAAMLFLFLLKGLFKHQTIDRSLYVEVTEKEQPELFRFIRQLARDTGAPFPRRVYLSPEVNAAVFYDSSLLSLILPVRKNLLIGLGLVNVLPLIELKAVLAHEFGHFSQSTMKVGSYVYMANRVIADMVYGRDYWDDLLAQWRAQDIRIGIFGWILSGVVWGLRKALGGIFQVINFADRALSRQMEFNADLVAVSVTGSDALVHALSRLDFAGDCLGQAMHDLSAARDHKLCTRDLFCHQTHAAKHLRAQRKDDTLGEPPPLPADVRDRGRVFEPGEGGVPSMWATHPANHDREENAKRHYVRSPQDDRSGWLLFRDAEAVREAVTRRYYRQAFDAKEPAKLDDPQRVQEFIDAEHAETTYHPRYHGLYDQRMLNPGEIDELIAAADARGPHDLLAALDRTFSDELKGLMEGHQEHQAEHELLSGLASGELQLKNKFLELRGRKYNPAEAPRLLEKVQADLEADTERMNEIDCEVFAIHYTLARQGDPALADELLARYRFHLAVQDKMRTLFEQQGTVGNVCGFLANNRQLGEGDLIEVVRLFANARTALGQVLKQADDLPMPALRNLEAGKPLGELLLDEELVVKIHKSDRELSGEWIGAFMRQLGEVTDRLRRMHFKSVGGLLALQERIEQQWRQKVAPAAEGAEGGGE
jgi:Zn-dependent protease with chaperone function